MKIIKIEPKNMYDEMMYDKLDNFLLWGCDNLPFIFLKKITMSDGTKVQLPRWVTQKYMDTIDKKVQEFMENINWE